MLKLAFINWWSNGSDDFFRRFIENYLKIQTIIDNNNPDIVFFSVFYKESPQDFVKNHPSIKIKIFFTGEDTTSRFSRGCGSDHYYLDFADISLGFKFIDHPNYIRFPLWLIYINIEEFNMGKPCLPFNKLLNFKLNKSNNFCCIVSNHDNSNTRKPIINKLSQYKNVHCAGSIFNCDKTAIFKRISCGKGENNKQILLNNYRFNICSESSLSEGYITEKLFECIIGGCIPIYNCDNKTMIEPDILNNDFIIKYNNNNIDEIYHKIINIDKTNTFINTPLTDDALQNIIKYYDKLKASLLEKLNSK